MNMEISLLKKGLVLWIIFLFIGAGVIPVIGGNVVEKDSNYLLSNGNTLYVGGSGPGNYTSIQDAIDDASDGDTVFVYDDSSPYYENPSIDKSINLIGENRNTTIIYDNACGSLVYIRADWVTVSGFTISGTGACSFGIRAWYSDHCTITDNMISNIGITGLSITGDSNIITNNILTNNDCAINLYGFSNNIMGNTITSDISHGYKDSGINIQSSRLNIIKGNNILNQEIGIKLESCHWTTITGNTISKNELGMLLEDDTQGNIIQKNNFLDNERNAAFHHSFLNRWMQNYWGKPRIFPKLIFGHILFIPWIQVDWRPAKEPYDI